MQGLYILDDKLPVETSDIHEWGRFMQIANRQVRHDVIGEVGISTVFLGLDHSFGEGPPLLFETMVFGGPLDQKQDRCSTWEEAETMHQKMLDRVNNPTEKESDNDLL